MCFLICHLCYPISTDLQLPGKQVLPPRPLPAHDPEHHHSETHNRLDGSHYALHTSDPQPNVKNARCPLCLATDSDLHWICDCPCPAVKDTSEASNKNPNKTSHTYYHNYKTYAESSGQAYSTAHIRNSYAKVH